MIFICYQGFSIDALEFSSKILLLSLDVLTTATTLIIIATIDRKELLKVLAKSQLILFQSMLRNTLSPHISF